MEAFTYKGIADGKYVEGDIEAINQEEASHNCLLYTSDAADE